MVGIRILEIECQEKYQYFKDNRYPKEDTNKEKISQQNNFTLKLKHRIILRFFILFK